MSGQQGGQDHALRIPAIIGGIPTEDLDVPCTIYFLAIFTAIGFVNIAIFHLNMKRKHKFIMSGDLISFAGARGLTCIMRIVWAFRPIDKGIFTTALIFFNSGAVLLYLINLMCAQRILRGKQPRIGWSTGLRVAFDLAYLLVGGCLVMGITSIIVQMDATDEAILKICGQIQTAAATFICVFAFAPFPLIATAFLMRPSYHEEDFGTGTMKQRVCIILATSTIALVIASFKAVVTWIPARPFLEPAWYDSRFCYYFFNFFLEIVIVAIFMRARIDLLFHVPDGCRGPGDYTRLATTVPTSDDHEKRHAAPSPIVKAARSAVSRTRLSGPTLVRDATTANSVGVKRQGRITFWGSTSPIRPPVYSRKDRSRFYPRGTRPSKRFGGSWAGHVSAATTPSSTMVGNGGGGGGGDEGDIPLPLFAHEQEEDMGWWGQDTLSQSSEELDVISSHRRSTKLEATRHRNHEIRESSDAFGDSVKRWTQWPAPALRKV